jgi:hypothetical protein
MLSILLLGVLAVGATVPSMLIAKLYLRSKRIEVASQDTIRKFMEVAPLGLKAVLITLNFTLFGAAMWVLFTQVL